MITFVYCCICLLIVCCQTTRIQDEDYIYTIDLPESLPQVENLRYKFGADILLKCPNLQQNATSITWEFKHCSSYLGIQCDKRKIFNLDTTESNQWKILDFGQKNRRRLKIKNATDENIGVYRCLQRNSIVKIFVVDLIVARYMGPSPEVLSLIPSTNSTIHPNSPLVIQCKVTSVIPPVIRWFKNCNGNKCELKENNYCYCALPLTEAMYSTSTNIYISKMNINHSRSMDSGVYTCLVISLYGKDYKNVTIKINGENDLLVDETDKSFSLLFLIPLGFILVPVSIWLCFYKKKKQKRRILSERQKELIKNCDNFSCNFLQ